MEKNPTMKILLKRAQKSDFVFFGELHDNPIAHWLELEVTKSLFDLKTKNLILAAEMFETDNQILIDEYFADIIRNHLLRQKPGFGAIMEQTISH